MQRKMNNKRKQLKNDITRIHEIMGINKPLLMEQAWVDDLVTSLINAGVKSESALIRAANRVANETLSAVERGKAFDEMVAAANVAAKQGDDAALNIIQNRIRQYMPSTIESTVSDLASSPASVDAFTTAVKNGYSDTEILDDIMSAFNPNTGDEVLDEVAKNAAKRRAQRELTKIRRSFADDAATAAGKQADDAAAAAGKQTDDVATDAGKQADDAATESADDITNSTDNLTDEQLETEGLPAFQEFDEGLKTWGDIPKLTDDEAKALLSVAKKDTNFYNTFKRNSDIINSRIERVNKLSRVLATTDDAALKTAIQSQIKKDLYRIGIEGKNYIGQVNNQLKLIIERFPRERGVIIDPNERLFAEYFSELSTKSDQFTNAKKMLDILTVDGDNNFSIFLNAWRNAWGGTDIITTIRNLPKRTSDLVKRSLGIATDDAVKETSERILKARQNSSNWLLTGSPRGNPWFTKYQKNYIDVIEASGLSAAKKSYAIELLIRLAKWKLKFAVAFTLRNAIAFWTRSPEKLEQIEACLAMKNVENPTKEQLDQACGGLDNFWDTWAMDLMEGGSSEESVKRFVKDIWDQVFVGEDSGLDEVTDYIPGIVDDIVIAGYDFVTEGFKNSTVETIRNSFEEAQTNALTNIDNTQSELDTLLTENGVTLETLIPAELSDYREHIKLIDGKMYYDKKPHVIKKIKITDASGNQTEEWCAWDRDDSKWYKLSDLQE